MNKQKLLETWSDTVAVDPGGTTGYAYISSTGIEFGQMSGNLNLFWNVFHVPARVICESFIITTATAKKSVQSEAINIIGGFRYLEATQNLDLTLQTPSVKRTVPDNELKLLGWYSPGKVHANDAAKHLVVFLRNQGFEI